jgi:hypothetical protein
MTARGECEGAARDEEGFGECFHGWGWVG